MATPGALESLSEDQQREIKKSNTGRLRSILVKANYDQDVVMKMERPQLMEAVAEIWLQQPEEGKSEEEIEENLEDFEQLSERERWKEEMRLRREQLLWEKQRWQMEREEKSRTESLEQERYEKEQRRLEREAEERRERLRMEDRKQKSLVSRLKLTGDSLKHTLPQQPQDSAELPLFFNTVEAIFKNFEVDKDLQAKLLLPLLSNRARAMISRLAVTDMDDYGVVKTFLLKEYKLTPREYRSKFTTATKQNGETFQLFASRLASLYEYYAKSRRVTDNYAKLCQLIVADRLKECLSAGALQYVLSLEGEDWFDPTKVASLADTYVSNYGDRESPRDLQGKAGVATREGGTAENVPKPWMSRANDSNGYRPNANRKGCYFCHSPSHVISQCEKKRQSILGRANNTIGRNNQNVQCNAYSVGPGLEGRDSHLEQGVGGDTAVSRKGEGRKSDESEITPSADCALLVSTEVEGDLEALHPGLKISPLQYERVIIDGKRMLVLCDSGAQIPIIRKTSIGSRESVGQVQIQGVVGIPVVTPLVALDVKLEHEVVEGFAPLEQTLTVVFAVTDDLAMQCDAIFPMSLVNELRAMTAVNLIEEPRDSNIQDAECPEDKTEVTESVMDDVINCDTLVGMSVSVEGNSPIASQTSNGDSGVVQTSMTDSIATEQLADATLNEVFKLAERGEQGYFIHQRTAFHKDVIAGQPISQLVVPLGRREHIFKVAHESVWSGHLRELKTKQRIKMSFYWPRMAKDIKKWNAECSECQLRAKRRTLDRVPITPIARAPLPFHTLHMDVVGPIQDKAKYPWILTIVDSCTRWPSAFLLRSLTARAVCDALLNLFAQVGVASVVISDRGTNFTSRMTDEFLRRMGCSPRLLSPNHPEAAGLVERYNATFKGLLAHVVHENPGTWYKLVPLIVWSTREVPNATTGVSPYQMVYGRIPRGILAVLRESWTGECNIRSDVTKSAVQYLQELKENLEVAAHYAEEHASIAQKRYADNYNLRAQEKTFDEGDRVVVLARDSTNKVYSRWRLGTVQRVLSKHSYLVDMGNGSVRHLHANHMRKFIAKVQSVVIVRDDEADHPFGRIVYPPSRVMANELLPSQRVSHEQISHLPDERSRELLRILDEFADVFANKPGLCTLLEHEIITSPEFKPKAFKAYRIPEVLRTEVNRQIEQLLEWGFIKPSQSPMASPIVCALKKDQSIRLAVNYVYLNKFTVFDAFPMPNAEDVMWRVSKSFYISCFDARSGYWQVPMCERDAWLTSFVTHDNMYKWLRCPFGLINSAATFVRMMGLILKPISEFAEPYIDDVGLHSLSWNLHLHHLVAYLTVMRKANLTLNLKKSSFAQPEIKMVGHIVGSGNHRPDPDKMGVLQGLERPVNKNQLRRALGMFGYYRAYQADFARIAKPLTDLTGKEVPNEIPWGPEHEQAFQQLKWAMCTSPVLKTPEFGKPFFIQSDACGVSVGCCLGQWDEIGDEHPIAYASKKLSATQQAWSVIEREAYAVIWALDKYRGIVFGSEITVYVDHNPLTYLSESAPKSAKLTRWLLALQEFKVHIAYKRGVDNKVADFLSRVGTE